MPRLEPRGCVLDGLMKTLLRVGRIMCMKQYFQ